LLHIREDVIGEAWQSRTDNGDNFADENGERLGEVNSMEKILGETIE